MVNKTRNYVIKNVESDVEWRDYLGFMWGIYRRKDDLPRYSRKDFLDPGNINLIFKVGNKIVGGMYAKTSSENSDVLTIHRFSDCRSTEFNNLMDRLGKYADRYKKMKLLVSTNDEIGSLKSLGFSVLDDHPNSSFEEPLVWVEKTIN